MDAYVDTSVLAAIMFEEPGSVVMARKLGTLRMAVSSVLLEAELRAAAAREQIAFDESQLELVTLLVPQRPLSSELKQVMSVGDLNGADLFHVASAVRFFGGIAPGTFLTLDPAQRDVARRLGFATDWSFAP
ncbi:MAG TPA: PIN domain-containing protein [Longimicrobiales bacterium]|nr:PIN domain-containing protein [Longimicrobiales bacterium]